MIALRKKINNYYLLTISPPYYVGNLLYKYSDDFFYLKFLKRSCDRYLIYPEHDDNDRLHYHGIIHIKDHYKWYKSTKRKLSVMGHIKVQKLKLFSDLLKASLYCSKDWSLNNTIYPHLITTMTHNRIKPKRPRRRSNIHDGATD